MKKLFLKEFEELITEKNQFGNSSAHSKFNFEISDLTGKLSIKNLEIRNLKTQIKGKTMKSNSKFRP